MEWITNWIVNFISRELKISSKQEVEIYKFGMIYGMELLLFIIAFSGIIIYFDMFPEGILFLINFIIIRSLLGGIHLKKYRSCFMLSCAVSVMLLWLVRYIVVPGNILFILIAVESFILLKIGPLECDNRILDEKEKKTFKRWLSRYLVIDIIFSFILLSLEQRSCLAAIAYTLGIIVVSALVLNVKNIFKNYLAAHNLRKANGN